MPGREYRFKFYLNAKHRVNIDNVESSIHPHTWEIVLHIKKIGEGLIQFAKIEGEIKEYLSKYDGMYLNEVEPFTKIEPYMENLGEAINEQIVDILYGNGWELRQLEVSENPSRTYIVTNEAEICTGKAGYYEGDKDRDKGKDKNKDKDKDWDYEVEKACRYDAVNIALKGVIVSADRIAVISRRIDSYDEVAASAEDLVNTAMKISKTLEKYCEDVTSRISFENEDKVEILQSIELESFQHSKIQNMDTIESQVNIEEVSFVENIDFVETEEQAAVTSEENIGINPKTNIEGTEKNKYTYLVVSFGVFAAVDVSLVLWLLSTGLYPWGSDSWYHLFKGHMLYNEILSGNVFPIYNELWYNGIEPLRYWAPVPHYVLAVIELLTGGNTPIAYNVFIGLMFFIGAFGWALWGDLTQRRKLALVLAVLWFFLPDNMRVMFSDGNLSRVVVSAIFPYLLLNVWSFFEKPAKKFIFGIFALMLIITFCHAMIAAMVGITIFVFSLMYGLINKKVKESLQIIAAAVLGVISVGIWLYPALKGGLVSMEQESVKELMKGLTYNISESLNPVLKLNSPDSFYFGISIILIAIIGLFLGGKKSLPGFGVTILIFLGTTKIFLSLIEKLPLSQLFWMMRFAPLALGLFFVGLLLWNNIRKGVLVLAIIFILADSIIVFKGLAHNAAMPEELKVDLDKTIEMTSQRAAVFDLSEFGSFPSYYLSYNTNGKSVKQVFGSGWQGARTSQNIMWLNTAFEKGWYSFMLDRCKEMGADTILTKKNKIKDMNSFKKISSEIGYKIVYESRLCMLLKMEAGSSFASKVSYRGLGIGKYAANISFIFPQVETGGSVYIDEYSEDKLSSYSVIYLSGFKYRNKGKAESMVRQLSDKGVRFIVDLTNAEADVYSSKPGFLGVMGQPTEFRNLYPDMNITDKSIPIKTKIPEEYSQWNTIYLENLDKVYGNAEFNKQELDFLGTKINDNIFFIGFNLPFLALETGNREVIGIIQSIIGLEPHRAPDRKLVELETEKSQGSIVLSVSEQGATTGISNLDAFKAISGEKSELHNLIKIEGNRLILKTEYPYVIEGTIFSAIGIFGFIILLFSFFRKKHISKVSSVRQVKQNGL